ncbi:MAG: radical SAM protein, partial [Clostridia bacterium]|nr:radical SAM protein [Clostridia bacterium]
MTSIDVGPIRPPSEAQSLLIRVTRNCPWNRCRFCQTYKGKKFSLRPVDEVKRDIEMVTEIFEEVKSHAWKIGHGGTVTKEVIYDIHRLYGPDHAQVAMWLANGGNTAFLQDADSLIRDPRECIDIIRFLKETFPSITRITTYARGRTIARKRTVGELKELKQAGLTRIHMGLETGYDPLLEYMHKGVTAREYITAGQKLKEAGIELCLYVI